MTRVPEFAAWVLIAAIGVATAALMATRGLSLDVPSLGKPVLACLGLTAITIVYRTRRPDERIAQTLACVAQIIAFSAAAELLSYAVASTGGPLWDATLMSWDLALGLDWRAYLGVFDRHHGLALVMSAAYESIEFQLIAVVALLGLTGRLSQCRVFALAVILSGLTCILVSGIVPAESMFVQLGLHARDYPALDVAAGFTPLAPFEALRDGTLRVISLTNPEGIISFPSYHTALGLIFAAALWPVRWARWPALAVNAVLVAATPIDGGHYFVDVIAGAAIAGLSLAVARHIDRIAQRRSVAPIAEPATGFEAS